MMAVFNYDVFGFHDLCGLCVLPCKHIPKLTGRDFITHPGDAERKNFYLPLFLVQETPVYR